MRRRSSPLAITSISLAGLLAVASTATVVGQGDGDPLAPVMPELGSVDERGRAFLPGTAEHPFGFYFAGVPGEVLHPDLAGLLVGVRQDAPGDGVKVQAGAKGKPNPVGPWDLLGSRSVAGSPGVVMSGLLGDIPADQVTVLGNDKAVRKAEEIMGVEFIVNGDILSGSEYGLGLSWDHNLDPSDDAFITPGLIDPNCANTAGVMLIVDAEGQPELRTFAYDAKTPAGSVHIHGDRAFFFVPRVNGLPQSTCAEGFGGRGRTGPPLIDHFDPWLAPVDGAHDALARDGHAAITGKGKGKSAYAISHTTDAPGLFDGLPTKTGVSLDPAQLKKKSNNHSAQTVCQRDGAGAGSSGATCTTAFTTGKQKTENTRSTTPKGSADPDAAEAYLALAAPVGIPFASDLAAADVVEHALAARQSTLADALTPAHVAKGTTVEMGTSSFFDDFRAIMRGRGDVNGDCRVDEVDVGLLRTPVLDAYPHPDDPESGGGSVLAGRTFDYSADVNGDGAVNSLDVQIVKENLGLGCSDSPT